MNELVDMELEEVSLVSEGANPEANVLLYKSKSKSANATTEKPQVDSVVVELAELRGMIKSLKETATKAQRAQEVESLRKYEVLDTSAEKLQRMLKAAKAHSQALYDTMVATLDESLAALQKSKVFAELGTSQSGVAGNVEQIAKTIQQKEPALSWREALDKAFVQEAKAK